MRSNKNSQAESDLSVRGLLSTIRNKLKPDSENNSANWHFGLLMDAAGLDGQISAGGFAEFILDRVSKYFPGVLEAAAGKDLDAIAVIQNPGRIGPCRTQGFSSAREKIPTETGHHIDTIYAWMFSSLALSDAQKNLRFLGREFLQPVHIRIVSEHLEIPVQEIKAALMRRLEKMDHFSPPIDIETVPSADFSATDALSSYCIYGWKPFEQALRSAQVGETECEIAVKTLRSRIASPDKIARFDHAFKNYLAQRNGAAINLAVEGIHGRRAEAPWYRNNRPFFDALLSNDYERILIKDATKDLDDAKGSEKSNWHTVNRVLGLQRGDEVIPAHDLMLKLRGLVGFRDHVNHSLDLIKAFSAYGYIHRHEREPLDFILDAGPLLVDCSKVGLDENLKGSGNLVGIFLQAINVPEGHRVFTSRAIRITDFWNRKACLKRIYRDAAKAEVKLPKKQVLKVLDEIAKKLWVCGLSIDYCDIAFFLDRDENISGYKLFDLERLSFGELTAESHDILRTLIDLKTKLLPEFWQDTLLSAYDRHQAGSPPPVRVILARLRGQEKRREIILRTLRASCRLSALAGSRIGGLIWSGLLSVCMRILAQREV